MEDLFGSDRSKKRMLALGIGAVAVAVAVLVVGVVRTCSTPAGPRPSRQFVCDSCGHKWDGAMTAGPKCPECGARPVLQTWYRCPKCRKVFLGLERQKLSVGKFRYRLPGAAEWLDQIPPELTCPGCRFTSADIYQHGLRAQPGGGPPDKAVPTGDKD